MTDPTASFPNEQYFEGLRTIDAGAIQNLYTAFRRPIIRAVEAAGGSRADGSTFFRVALIHASTLARDGQPDTSIAVFPWLQTLAICHFRDWATEKNLELPAPPPLSEAETACLMAVPSTEARLECRQRIRAKRQFSRLESGCRKTIQAWAQDAALGISDAQQRNTTTATCLEKYRKSLGEPADAWPNLAPAWAVTALTDTHFQQALAAVDAVEGRLSMGQSSGERRESKVTRNVMMALILLVAAYGIWDFFSVSTSPKAVYAENFKPPTSIMADRADRFARDTSPMTRVETCEQLFETADETYQRQDYRETAAVLYTMIGSDMEDCNSEALYYLAIVGLQLNEPELTVQCLAKIPDLDRFGEDLYWYQALAFVKIAEQNPARRDIARRAVERARSNTEVPERRSQAAKMLEQLAR
jgi:hypothetical protein